MDQGIRAASAAAMYSSTDSLRQHLHQHNPLQHGSGMGRPDITSSADARDQEQLINLELPITYMPFKFENRRVRIDWRLLHGVDIDKLVSDTDLDTLEQLVTCVTWGDIEAEDTRHLSEGNFVKVFRLAQLLLEYLLYVQENLKYTNNVLDKSRSAAVLHAQSLSTRCRDLYTQLKHCKRELKRTHKTIKTFELMAAAVGGAAQAAAAQAAAQAAATPTKQDAAVQQQQQAQVQPVQQQQQPGSIMTAGEMLLQSQLTELTERLTLAVCEAERLRTERQELQYQIRHLHDTLAAKLGGSGRQNSSSGGGRAARDSAAEAATAAAVAAAQQEQQQLFMAELQCAQAQIQELQSQNKDLRLQLQQQNDAAAEAVAAAAASPAVEDLQAQLGKQAAELARLQSELRERDASISVFETTNTTLKQQLEALQRQLTSPEATTPSFVAKQRQQLAAAANAQAGLQSENMKLRQELLELRLALEARGGAGADNRPSRDGGRGSATAGEEDALAEAERLLSDGADEGLGSRSDWKVQEIERLQEENRQLQAKVASLQEALHDLEAGNMRLEKRLAAAQAAGFAPSPSPQASPNAAAAIAEAAGLTGEMGGSGWASVSSSGPAAELTAADLPIAGAVRPATASGSAAESDAAVSSMHLEQSDDSIAAGVQQLDAEAAAAHPAAMKAAAGGAAAVAAAGDSPGKVMLANSSSVQEGSSDGGRIAAYRPSRDDSTAGAGPNAALQSKQQQQEGLGRGPGNASSNGGSVGGASSSSAGVARGSIDQAAAQQLRSIVAELQAELAPEQLAAEYAEVCSDWDKPFDLTDEEKAQFRQHVPYTVTGLEDVLCAQPHTAEEVSACKPGMLPLINRILDSQVASYGIHPGRTGLSNVELVAVMKMLGERREAMESGLSQEQRSEVEITRLALLLHPYHALQGVMATLPDGPDSKKHLPAVTPALASAVRPPASSLPPPPPPIRLQPRGPSPLGSPGGFGLPAAAATAAAAGEGPVTLYTGSAGATPSPSASARYGVAAGNGAYGGADTDSEEGGGSPVRRQELYSTATYHAGGAAGSAGPLGAARAAGSSGGGGLHLRAPSPLGNEAAREAIAKATASGSFSPMSAALQAKQQLLGSPGSTGRSVSPGGGAGSPTAYASSTATSGVAAGTGLGGSPVKQQLLQQQAPAQVVRLSPTGVAGPGAAIPQQQQQPVSAAVALATKQYLAATDFEESDEF